jgi:NhaP-type Na+/H+ or K+/H+ antiporter
MVPVAIALMGTRAQRPTVAFLGWFGPRGLASIVFGVIVVEASGVPHASALTEAIVVTVALSVLLHGITAVPLTNRYSAWSAAALNRGAAPMEGVEAPEQRWRRPTR